MSTYQDTLLGYIRNLSAVPAAKRSAAQAQALATYINRYNLTLRQPSTASVARRPEPAVSSTVTPYQGPPPTASLAQRAGTGRNAPNPTGYTGPQRTFAPGGAKVTATPTTAVAPTSPSALPADPRARLQLYIGRILAVPAAKRTAKQSSELTTYQARLAALTAPSTAPSAGAAPGPAGAAVGDPGTVAGIVSTLPPVGSAADPYGVYSGGPMQFTPSQVADAQSGGGGGLGLTDIAIIGGAILSLIVVLRSKGKRS